MNQNVIATHQLGDLFVNNIAIRVENVESTAENWSTWFQLPVSATFVDEKYQSYCRKLHLTGGDIVFCAPYGRGMTKRILLTRGPKPFAITFRNSNEDKEFWYDGILYCFQK